MNTVSQAVEGFILDKEAQGLSPSTVKDYRLHLKRFAARTNGKGIEKVTNRDAAAFLKWYRQDYRITHRGGQPCEHRPVSEKSVRNCWTSLSAFFGWVAEEYEIDNPFKVKSPRYKSKEIHPLDKAEVERLLAFADVRARALILALLDTSARISELMSANVQDLDPKSGALLLTTTKNGHERTVYLGKVTLKALWKYLRRRGSPETGPLFTGRSGKKRMTPNAARLVLRRLGEKAGVDNVHPHRMRHSGAVALLRNGASVFAVQELLGHATLDMTRRYVKLAQSDLAETAKRCNPSDNWRL